MNIQRFVAILAILIAVLLALWVVTNLEDETSLGSPRTKDKALPAYVATIPRIGDFKSEFNINEVNPFVPFDVSQRAEAEIKGTPRIRPPVTRPVIPPPPQNPVVVDQPAKPRYPALKPKDIGAPECLGVVRKGDTAVLVARRPGEEKVNLEVGGVINGWTLREIAVGVARFSDPAGELHELPIGTADATAAPDRAEVAPMPAPRPVAPPPSAPPSSAPPSSAPLRPGQPTTAQPQANQPQANPENRPSLNGGAMQQPSPAPEMVPLRPRPK